MISYGNEYYIIDWEKYKATLIECECNECTSEPGTTAVENKLNSHDHLTTMAVLGTLVGLLLVLLVLVTTGWVWTWWSMREKRMNSEQIR